MLLHVLGILCGISVVVFASLEAGRPRGGLVFVAAWAGTTALVGVNRVPDPVWAASFAAAGAGLALGWPRATLAALACGGVVAAFWSAVLAAQGLPVLLSWALVLAVAGLCHRLAARRPEFAPPAMRDEAFVLVAAAALAIAAAPAVVDGWHSAAALNAAPVRAPEVHAGWAVSVLLAAFVAGGIHSLWRRR